MKNNNKVKLTLLVLISIIFVVAIFIVVNTYKPHSQLLNLQPREQWENSHGYCGETSIQTDALYYGTYISQDLARKIAGSELLISENDDQLFDALKFDEWNFNTTSPQYKSYLVWTKRHLKKGHPFVAKESTKTIFDTFMSNTLAIYRCVKAAQ